MRAEQKALLVDETMILFVCPVLRLLKSSIVHTSHGIGAYEPQPFSSCTHYVDVICMPVQHITEYCHTTKTQWQNAFQLAFHRWIFQRKCIEWLRAQNTYFRTEYIVIYRGVNAIGKPFHTHGHIKCENKTTKQQIRKERKMSKH